MAPATEAAPRDGRVPVIVVLADDGRDAWLRQIRPLLMDESSTGTAARNTARERLTAARRSGLLARGARLARFGLAEPRVSLAGGALMGWCPVERVKELRRAPGVVDVMIDRVLDAQMNVSVPSLLPDPFYDAGFRGQTGDFEVGVLDAGVDGSHPAFDGLDLRYHIDHTNAAGDPFYDDSSSNPDDLSINGHGTHIAGIIVGRAAPTWEAYVGVAPATPRLYNLKSGFRRTGSDTAGLYFSDALDNIDWGIFSAADDIDSLNFSWGSSTSSDDSGLARFFDAVVDDLGVPVTLSAGNNGPAAGTVIDPAICYNALTIGATNDAATILRGDDNVTGDSARGPTPGGRKKPDLVAPGFIIQSPTNLWETQLDYNFVSGTSFAAPHALGAVQLIMGWFGPGVSPRQIKALLVASASPGSFYDSGASVEWDPAWGWGYINLERAWDYRQSVFSHAVAPAGQSDDYKLYRGPMQAVSRAALVWHRHVSYISGGGQPGTAGALNDLNMRLYNHADGTLLDASTSGIDNVEVVSVTLSDYDAVIKVYAADSSFSRVSNEAYALATPPGFVFPDTLPRPDATLLAVPGDPYRLVAVLGNSGDFNAHAVETDLSLPGGVSIAAGLDRSEQGTLIRNGGNTRIVEWLLESETQIAGTAGLDLESPSYGETYTGSDTEALGGQPTGLGVALTTDDATPAAGEPFLLIAEVTNHSASLAIDLSITLINESGVTIQSGGLTQLLGTLASGASTTASWAVSIDGAGQVRRLLTTARGETAGGGELAGAAVLAVGSRPFFPPASVTLEPVAPERVEPGEGLEVKARVTNAGQATINNLFLTLNYPPAFILAGGSDRQPVGSIGAGQTLELGRWLFIAPASVQVGDFSISADIGGEPLAATPFQIAVGRDLPPAPPLATQLVDAPLLQTWTAGSDNDPVGLTRLPDGRYVFYNAQSGAAPGHEALIAFDPNAAGTDGLEVLATQAAFQQAVGSRETVTVTDIERDPAGRIYVLAVIERASSADPVALLELTPTASGVYSAPMARLRPGAPPLGLQSISHLESANMAWDAQGGRLLILSDNGTTADDPDRNGLYAFAPGAGQLELVATNGELSAGLQPRPVPGIDPIGFTALTADTYGNVYLLHTYGAGGNAGDIVKWRSAGQATLFADSAALLGRLAPEYADLPVRLAWSTPYGRLAILVPDTATATASGEAALTEWSEGGRFPEVLATRGQLLSGTGAGRMLNFGHAMVAIDGGYALWSAADNETLLNVPTTRPNAAAIFMEY